ncbi:hypothetical protein T11_7116 [Trichinella zimbabwensis]|uniref:Uncharacterized protein n=1 Tax=Trichinella zimbabwensis TaxID=268475 RepID=A0A0V1HTV4_9BILA|nr:hypothetical protein T11_7116 [Trichinella zimbabwensis]
MFVNRKLLEANKKSVTKSSINCLENVKSTKLSTRHKKVILKSFCTYVPDCLITVLLTGHYVGIELVVIKGHSEIFHSLNGTWYNLSHLNIDTEKC